MPVPALVGDCEGTVVVGDTVPEDMDVGDDVRLVVRVGEELVGDGESLVDGGTLLDTTVVGTALHNGSKRVWMINRQLTRTKEPGKT